ncbi:hypothetical protein AAG570_010027 [Ranatra chinensis]|uniref:Cytochrome P450 n=1 Tax=Ranatra chinensis TaxID=642074 RepID=A0ABD0YLI8_9HEMI
MLTQLLKALHVWDLPTLIKIIGEEDVKNLETNGKLFLAFDGCNPNLFVADTDMIKVITTDKRDSFKSYRGHRVKQSVVMESLENIEQENVKYNSVLTEANIKKLMPRIERSAEAFVQEMKKKKPNGGIYVQPFIMQYIGDVIAMSVFGMDLYSDEHKEQRSTFMGHLNRVFKVDNPTSFTSIFPYISLGCLDSAVLPSDATDYFVELCHSVVHDKRKENTSGNANIEGRACDLIDLLLEVTKDVQPEKTESSGEYVEDLTKAQHIEKDITIQCLSVILFAVRSTELTLARCMQVLANSEEEQTKVHDEIVKNWMPSIEHSDHQTWNDSKYLDLFLKEIHRLYPIEFRLVRECNNTVKLGDVSAEAGTTVSVPIYAIHRQKNLFEDPLQFKPDRFEKGGSLVGYLPFGQANSNPDFIGVRLEAIFVKTAVAHLLKAFKLLPPALEFQAPCDFAKGLTEVPVAMPVFILTETRA